MCLLYFEVISFSKNAAAIFNLYSHFLNRVNTIDKTKERQEEEKEEEEEEEEEEEKKKKKKKKKKRKEEETHAQTENNFTNGKS